MVAIHERVNQQNHVLAGDILAANNTASVKKTILDFLSRLT